MNFKIRKVEAGNESEKKITFKFVGRNVIYLKTRVFKG